MTLHKLQSQQGVTIYHGATRTGTVETRRHQIFPVIADFVQELLLKSGSERRGRATKGNNRLLLQDFCIHNQGIVEF
jgi:hypothetical protein